MRFSLLRAILIALVSVSFTVKICGELIMIRYPPMIENGTKVQRITCISENDGNAFVWNGDLNDTSDDRDFKEHYSVLEKCHGIHSETQCTALQPSEDWKVVNVADEPMSPIVDFRWEDFKDYEAERNEYLSNLHESGTIVFSVRGSQDVNLRFGEHNTAENNSCFRIILAASNSTESAIRACDGQGSKVMFPEKRSLISPFEWRTYIINWNGTDKIEVKQPGEEPWDPTEKIMEMRVDRWVNISQLFVENGTGQWFRFHNYRYHLTTTKSGAELTGIISDPVENLYAVLPVSLCSKCQLNVILLDNNNKTLETRTINSKNTVAENELPFWQLEQLPMHWNETSYERPVVLRMSTHVTQPGYKGRWAYAYPWFRKSKDNTRSSTRTLLSDASHFSCQKLSGIDGPSVVHSNGKITNINSTNLDKCIEGTGKFCDFKCGGSCKGTSICNQDGCTCAPGFTGINCDEGCPPRKFGYNCQKNCDSKCKNHKCDRLTGCQAACLDHFLPPNCTKELIKPDVQCIPETGVQLKYSMVLDENERRYLRFQITSVPKKKWKNVTLSLQHGSPWYWSKKAIEDLELKPMEKYMVRAVLDKTYGQPTEFNTRCWELSKPQNISLISRDNGTMTLKWRHNPSLWEKKLTRTRFEIYYSLLDLNLRSGPWNSIGHIENTTTNSSREQQMYRMKVELETTKNYTFSIQTKDENYISKAMNVSYLIPNEDTFDRSEEKLPNSTMKRISWKFPGYAKDSKEIYVIMQRSSICPILKPSQNSTEHSSTTKENFSRPGSLEEGEYPACTLNFNEPYLFVIAAPIKNEELWKSKLIWLIVIPISAICCYSFYVLYWKKNHSSVNLCLINQSKLLPINKPEESLFDNCVPPEVQKLRRFENYVRKATENGVLQQQFMSLPRGLVRPCVDGRLPDNKPKNRYGNLIAYDDTRVLLSRDSRGIHSDYINANYVQGYCKEKAYIATQGPLAETIVDFWRMIWQEEVHVICMLVDLVEGGKNMCEQYWPEIGEEIRYGDIVILTMKQRSFADYTYRTFLVTKSRGTQSQTVEHLQYTGWPEEGIPMYSHSVVEFLQKLLSVPPGRGPVVVHCSSGTGRTGAMILADICWRHLAVEGTVDVFAEAKKMYNARADMLRNFPQYILSHLVPTQCLIMLPRKILCSDVTQEKIEEMKNDLPTHVARLADCAWMDKALRSLEPLRPPDPENIQKNRFPKLTPVGPNLVTLTRYPTYDKNSDYISAVSVDGVKIKKQYVASQLPMPSTLTDFWRLIVEQNIELIVILQHPDPEDITCCDIIPRGTTLIPVPYLKVETKGSSKRNQYFTTDKLLLTDTSQKLPRTRTITTLTCNNWSPEEVARPPPPETLVELWRASENIKRTGPTLVLCYDGINGCGLYLTLSFLLERMGLEQECDLILAVRAVRQSRPEFMCFQWQFEYLYDAAVKYVECFQTYANFNRGPEANHWCE